MPKVVKSLRVEPKLWGAVETFGEKNGLKTNAAAEELIRRGLTSKELTQPAAPASSLPLRMPQARPGSRLKTKVGRSKWVLFQ